MPDVVTVALGGDREQRAVARAAGLLATAYGAEVTAARPADDRLLRWALDPANRDGVMALAVPDDDSRSAAWQLATAVPTPLLLVPSQAVVPPRLRRVLLPLDGTVEASDAVAPIGARLQGHGVGLVVLHVFDADTVPAHWDQSVHAARDFAEEFRLRSRLDADARLEIRSGVASADVLAVAREAGCDLVVLAWCQSLDDGRAATTRAIVSASHLPVLLVARRRATADVEAVAQVDDPSRLVLGR
ncbi:MAG: universal stress protein [Jatrophihabitans sp.]|uniref:universal stress protein n=1 Tax=Jatrophihabitans sp. TaxID=1932789 RepID=UPI003F80B2E8